jgi:hypothetical protein
MHEIKPEMTSQNSTIPKHLLPRPPPRTHEYNLLPPSSTSGDTTEKNPLYDNSTASKFLLNGIQKMSIQNDSISDNNTKRSNAHNDNFDHNPGTFRTHGNPTPVHPTPSGYPASSSSAILNEDINQDSYTESLHSTWRQPTNETVSTGITILSSCDYEKDEDGDNPVELNGKMNNIDNTSTQRKKSKIDDDLNS